MQTIDLKQLAGWLADTDIGSLELRSPGGGHVSLRRGDMPGIASPVAAQASTANGTRTAKATSVGVFLDRHPLRDKPFVQPGDALVEDQLVGLLQIGALLLPVRSPCVGIASASDVAPGSTVGYGTPLMQILPQGEPHGH